MCQDSRAALMSEPCYYSIYYIAVTTTQLLLLSIALSCGQSGGVADSNVC